MPDRQFLPALFRLLDESQAATELMNESIAHAVESVSSLHGWDNDNAIKFIDWVYVVVPYVETKVVAQLFPKISLEEHKELREELRAERAASNADCEVRWLKTMPYADYLQTEHWQKVRGRALELAGHRCQLCNTDSRLHVHHRTYERRGEEDPGDLTVLCAECHRHFHEKLRVNG